LPLEAEVYGLEYVPFAPQWTDGVVVALAALAISYLITIYPSSSAAKVAPVEVLRYE
jgi:lipoprotein-releasing system permease protein